MSSRTTMVGEVRALPGDVSCCSTRASVGRGRRTTSMRFCDALNWPTSREAASWDRASKDSATVTRMTPLVVGGILTVQVGAEVVVGLLTSGSVRGPELAHA